MRKFEPPTRHNFCPESGYGLIWSAKFLFGKSAPAFCQIFEKSIRTVPRHNFFFSASFYPDRDSASKGTFGGPVFEVAKMSYQIDSLLNVIYVHPVCNYQIWQLPYFHTPRWPFSRLAGHILSVRLSSRVYLLHVDLEIKFKIKKIRQVLIVRPKKLWLSPRFRRTAIVTTAATLPIFLNSQPLAWWVGCRFVLAPFSSHPNRIWSILHNLPEDGVLERPMNVWTMTLGLVLKKSDISLIPSPLFSLSLDSEWPVFFIDGCWRSMTSNLIVDFDFGHWLGPLTV